MIENHGDETQNNVCIEEFRDILPNEIKRIPTIEHQNLVIFKLSRNNTFLIS